MYAFVNATFNPIKGSCQHACRYCYMNGIRHRFHQDPTLRLDSKALQKRLGKDKYIFVGSSTDMWAVNVRSEWIRAVLDHLAAYPGNTYHLQSKAPERFLEFTGHTLFTAHKDKLILTTTIESDKNYPDVSSAPAMAERIAALKTLSDQGFNVSITVEPIMAFSDSAVFADMLASVAPVQVNIGANSSRAVKLPEPTKAEVNALISELKARGIKVHIKANLDRILR